MNIKAIKEYIGWKFENTVSPLVSFILESYWRNKIQAKDFTILCSNCSGGIIYNRLGMKFLSPTINLWIRQYDFIKLARNPKWYLAQKLEFIESKYPYPVARLGDIRIHFNHSVDQNSAEKDWNRRLARVNWDNLYFLMYDRDGITREQILQLKDIECRNKVVLTEKRDYSDIEYVHYIARTNDGANSHYFLDKDIFGVCTLEKKFDFVKWLNDGQKCVGEDC